MAENASDFCPSLGSLSAIAGFPLKNSVESLFALAKIMPKHAVRHVFLSGVCVCMCL